MPRYVIRVSLLALLLLTLPRWSVGVVVGDPLGPRDVPAATATTTATATATATPTVSEDRGYDDQRGPEYNTSTPPSRNEAAATAPSLHVSMGRMSRGRGGLVVVPLYVSGKGTFYSVDVQLGYDPLQLSAIGVRRLDKTLGAIMAFNANVPGLLTIAFASGEPLHPTKGALLLAQFRAGRNRPRASAVHLLRGLVDDR